MLCMKMFCFYKSSDNPQQTINNPRKCRLGDDRSGRKHPVEDYLDCKFE